MSANDPAVMISLSKNKEWTVAYEFEDPVSRLVFNRSPDDSRAKRWHFLAQGFKFEYIAGVESIVRQDKKKFTRVALMLTPTYVHLPKEYAPFSPFSEGGMLVYTGRFFACAELCSDQKKSWNITVSTPPKYVVIAKNIVGRGEVAWTDQSNGSKVYVGMQMPAVGRDFVAVVDESLPQALKDHLQNQMPILMSFFSRRMHALSKKPMLFASYGQTETDQSGRQGGVLANQLFMHWYGKKPIDLSSGDDVSWFFAHEIAHLFQRSASQIERREEGWVHEGAAELMAGLALTNALGDSGQGLNEKLKRAENDCMMSLREGDTYSVASARSYKIHYSCGLLIHNAINDEVMMRNGGMNLFDVWLLFADKVDSDHAASAATFIEVLKPYLSCDLFADLLKLARMSDYDAVALMKKMVSGFYHAKGHQKIAGDAEQCMSE